MPSDSDLTMIYRSILGGHMASFSAECRSQVDGIVEASIKLHKSIAVEFLPDAERFTYNWNMRELANIFQGLCQARSDFFPQPMKVLRLWVHEAQRVFGDRLVDATDMAKFDAKLKLVTKAVMKDVDQDKLFEGPNSECTVMDRVFSRVGYRRSVLCLSVKASTFAALSLPLSCSVYLLCRSAWW